MSTKVTPEDQLPLHSKFAFSVIFSNRKFPLLMYN